MDRFLRGAIVSFFGIDTTILTAIGLVYLELHYDCAIYGLVYGFVLPFGAMLCGLVAASGYYAGSRVMSYRPGRWFFIGMMAVSCGNFFLIYWLKYTHLRVDGESIRNWMPFADYLRYTLTHTAITLTRSQSDAFELGAGGYAYAVVLILGFALGGYIVFALTRSAAYCDACSLYMKKQGSQTRYFVRREDAAECCAEFQAEEERGRVRRAAELHGRAGLREMNAKSGYLVAVEFKHCARCGKQWFELVAKQRVNNSWNRICGRGFLAYCAEPVDVVEKLAGSYS